MKNILLTLFLLISLNGICMLNGTVTDKESNKPVPYANIWIENEDIGTTSDIDGKFRFDQNHSNKNLVVSAVGYESQTVKIDSSFLEIMLVPIIYQIPEVNVKPNQKKKELIISRYKKSKIRHYSGPSKPHIYARYFPYKYEYKNTPFIKSVMLETFSAKIESRLNLRFLMVDSDGEPGNDVLDKNVVVDVKRGRKSITVDNFNDAVIPFPKNGLFIAIEFFVIKENAVQLRVYNTESKKREKATLYMPYVGEQKNQDDRNCWIYFAGKWHNEEFENVICTKEFDYCIAMEVVLSN